MGICGSMDEDGRRNQEVLRTQQQDRLKEAEVKKLLLLGAGGSGKSTFFKQLQRIHGTGFSVQERANYRSKINEQILSQMKLLVQKCREMGGDDIDRKGNDVVPEMKLEDPEWSLIAISVENAESADFIDSIPVVSEITNDIARHLKALWEDVGVQAAWQLRAKLGLFDSTRHFMDDLDRVISPTYSPTDQDLILNRYMTTGMTQKEFVINDSRLNIVDVGGQRSERRKWIHFFDGVTAILFVASLSCYDELLFEDNTTNGMHETLKVFDQTWNSEVFQRTAFILFLNKDDVFRQKLQSTSINVAFPDYTGSNAYEESLDYITYIFESRCKDEDSRNIYTHVTMATDENNVEKVFNDVQHIIINSSLQNSGIL